MESFDYIVVGAGSAGAVVARRLSDNSDNRVLLLEAGPTSDRFWVHTPAGMAKLYFHKHLNWNYFTEPMPELLGRKMYWPRGKGLGGSSSVNGMIFIRGHPKDFDTWASQGNPGWGYSDVLPYFKRLEHNERGADEYRGAGGPIWVSDPVVRHPASKDFVESAVRAGIPRTEDMNGAVHDGVGFMQHTIRAGRRCSAYVAYIKPVEGRPNLVVRTGCHVKRILFERNVATGVEVVDAGQLRVIKAAKEVVLSAGALNTPQILLLSGVGPATELQRFGIDQVLDSPGVGRNLQDHFYIHTEYRSTPDSSYNHAISGARKYLEGLKYLLTRSGYLALGSSQVAAFFKSGPEEDYADLQISFRPMAFKYHGNGVVEVDPKPSIAASVFTLRPSSTGTVTLRSPDPLDPPVLQPNFLATDYDVNAMIVGIRRIREIMASPPIASRVIAELLPGPQVQTEEQLLDFLRATGNSAQHGTSTCKMGRDALSVVDERLRVRGLERVRVIDASIMPHVTSGNTNAPTLMIGEKGAEMIAQDAASRRS